MERLSDDLFSMALLSMPGYSLIKHISLVLSLIIFWFAAGMPYTKYSDFVRSDVISYS